MASTSNLLGTAFYMSSAQRMPLRELATRQSVIEQPALSPMNTISAGGSLFCSAAGSVALSPFPRFQKPWRDLYDIRTPIGGSLKRSIDIVIATILLLVLAPVLIYVAALIYLTMGRPILFSHKRVGFQGATFECYKFRTMVNNAGEKLEAYLREDPAAREEWKHYHKLKFDPRVTTLGRLLRKSSLDELPQLLNVLRGDMSCVGPRPVTIAELSRYKSSARHYLQVRPGVTGLWQVSGRSNTSYDYRVALDRTYVANWSFGLDIKILVKTLPAVLRIHESA